MSFSPADILARLDELKKWQEKQQERLMQQHHSRLKENEKNTVSSINQIISETASRVDSNQKPPPKKVTFWHEESLDAKVKSFKAELEDRLASEPHNNNEEKPKNIIKKPFLKRGQGLIRYKMNLGDIAKKKSKSVQNSKPELKKDDLSNCKNVEDENKEVKITPLRKPDINFEPKAKWLSVENQEFPPSKIDLGNDNVPIRKASFKHTFDNVEGKIKSENNVLVARQNIIEQINMFALQKTNNDKTKLAKDEPKIDGDLTLYEKALEKELRVFEALEQKAMNSSFSSTNSSVVRLLSSTPSKDRKHKNVSIQLDQRFEVHQHPNDETNEGTDLISFEEDNVELIRGNRRENMKIEQEQSFLSDHNETSIKSSDLRALLERFIPKIKENNPSLFRDLGPARKNDIMDDCKKYFENNLFKDFPSDSSIISDNNDVDDDDTLKSGTEIENDGQPLDFNDRDKWSDNECDRNGDVPPNKCEKCSRKGQENYSDVAVMTEDFNQKEDSQEEREGLEKDMVKKLRDLDEEIEKFRQENVRIAKVKKEIELERLDFRQEHREQRKKLEEEREHINQYLDDEKKKLAKEKMVFERYVKDSQNKPSRKEREEITILKGEVENLKETLKLKETKNCMTQARLRNQIKRLEKENSEFKTQIENLQKQNAKMLATQKICRPSDTRMLHEINKNITKLALNSKKSKRSSKSFSEDSDNDSSGQEAANYFKNKSNNNIKKRTKSLSELEICNKVNKNKNGKKQDLSLRGASNSKIKYSKKTPAATYTDSEEDNCSDDSMMNDLFSDEKNLQLNKKNKEYKYIRPNDSNSFKHRDEFNASGDTNKENDTNISNLKVQKKFHSPDEFENIEKQYEKLFGTSSHETTIKPTNNALDESKDKKDRIERVLSDGSKEIKYPNGNIKTVSKDGNLIMVNYYNGDVKETNLLVGTVRYYYKENRIWHTTFPDGSELLEFPDGQTEKKFKDGSHEVKYIDGTIRTVGTSGTEKITYVDGTVVTINSKGDKILELPSGEKEIHTNEQKRREYPDGTVKTIYANGTQETKYANGRIRIKDQHGNLIMDSEHVGKCK